MAELLILAFDTHNIDPELDRFAYKLGHIIDIKPDDHVWGSQETLPKFWIVKIPGMSVSDAMDYISKLQDLTDPNEPVDIGMRKWKFDYATLPANVRNTLNKTGVISINASTIVNYMTRITG